MSQALGRHAGRRMAGLGDQASKGQTRDSQPQGPALGPGVPRGIVGQGLLFLCGDRLTQGLAVLSIQALYTKTIPALAAFKNKQNDLIEL